MSDSETPGTTAHQAFLSFTIPKSLLKLLSTESVMPSIHLILCGPLLLPSIFPSIRVFFSESALCIRWPKYWNFSISPSNYYSGLISFRIDWFISLLSKGLSRVICTTIWKHQFFGTHSSLWSIKGLSRVICTTIWKHQFFGTHSSLWSTFFHEYWKNHSCDHIDIYWQSGVSVFKWLSSIPLYSAPQFESINFLAFFFMVQLSHPHMSTGKTIAVTI